jgi:dephospho-CoA kinase
MKKIGVTGGIGSGKTVVCDIFRTLGVKVYNADIRAKEILNSDHSVRSLIMENFGDDIYADGMVDRKRLAAKVFNNPVELSKLNAIVHPAVAKDFENFVESNLKEAYIIKEAAILFESGTYKQLDSIVLVYAPVETRIKRVLERDKTDRSAVLARINNQMDDTEKMHLSNHIIYNNDEVSLIKQVIELHNIFKEK